MSRNMERDSVLQNKPESSKPDSSLTGKRRGLKRSPRACDECRSRKIRCNGQQPCESCADFDRSTYLIPHCCGLDSSSVLKHQTPKACTYSLNSRRPPDPRQRSRYLQHRLGQIRATLDEVKNRNSPLTDEELQSLVEILDADLSAGVDLDAADDSSTNATLDSMMSSYGHDASNNPRNARFYGAPSGLAFLQRTQEFFTAPSSDVRQNPHLTISQLFDAPFPTNYSGEGSTSAELLIPSKETAIALLTTVFRTAYLLFPIFDEFFFFQMVDHIYNEGMARREDIDAFMPLFHIVLGVGYLFSQSEHQKRGCHGAIAEA